MPFAGALVAADVAIEVSAGGPTVIVSPLLVTPYSLEVTVVVPCETAVSRPVEDTVATAGLLLVHVALDVMLLVVPSPKPAVEVSWSVVPFGAELVAAVVVTVAGSGVGV